MAYNRYTTSLLSYTSRTHRPRCISNLATALVNACSSFFALLPTFRRSAAGHGRVLGVAGADRQLTTAVLPWITKMRKNDKATRGVGWIGGLCDNGGGCRWSVS
ncbi:hypothetical protein T4E_1354 [Trichinella pseudospiralis]|uniref:Uncharacterized protein n=1 Tax=Trichinella pseudospiralis TaxID=6337 RepID=A0A0V0YL37_TRIPS|nr:hypothetical protein T4E_1354 [Trichinella pseudospiralis]